MVIIIMGVIGAMVAVFMKSPIDAYFDSARRAALTDVADTVVRRMARDIRKALPNSLRLPTSGSSNACIEFIPTKAGGRYRAQANSAGAGDILDFSITDSSFDMLGANSTLTDQAIGVGDLVAVYNLGIPGADAYARENITPVSSTGVSAGSLGNEAKINITAFRYPLASGSNRFHVIPSTEPAVSFGCVGAGVVAGEGVGTLYRYVRDLSTTFACPASLADVPGASVLAQGASACSFVYNGSDLRRNAMVQVSVRLTRSGETVNLYHEVHVDNTP